MKIAVCMPHTGTLKAETAQCLAGMTFATGSASLTYNGVPTKPHIDLLFSGMGPLEWKRTSLAQAALHSGSDYLLWIDSDHTFPNDALIRLMGHDKPMVGVSTPSRHTGRPTVFDLQGEPLGRRHGVEQVGAVGLGFCLMKTPILNRVPRPWFAMEIDRAGRLVRGEDIHFCNQVRSVDIPIYVDHDLEIGHIAEQVLRQEREGEIASPAAPAPRGE